jgi:hypothetical protein
MLLGEANELPLVGERAVVAVLQLIEDDAAGLADTGRRLQQLDELLCGQAAGRRLGRGDQEGEAVSGSPAPAGKATAEAAVAA